MASWTNGRNRGGTMNDEDYLDRENQQKAKSLAGKVNRLKSLALDIESEAKDQNVYLDSDMDHGFDSATGLLTGSMKRIGNMVSSGPGNRKLICYMVLFTIMLFFLVYFILTWVRK